MLTVFDRSVLDNAKRIALWLLSGFTILSGYALAKLEPFRTAVELPLTAIDQAIPLVPSSIWLYGSGTFVCLIAWLCVPDGRSARRLYFTLTMSAILCWLFFFAFPTTYPRHLWPLPEGDSWTLWEFRDLRGTDSPSNCFPSQHVALAWSLALCWMDWSRTRLRWLPLVWAVGVSVCTLTTKQHYLVDIPGGFLAGALSWWVVRRSIVARDKVATLAPTNDRDRAVIAGLLGRVRAHQWSLDDIAWPDRPLPALPSEMARLLNQTVYVEEIAARNFDLLARGSVDGDLRALYRLFAIEERRHAEGLRRVLTLHGHPIEPPGLGTALILDQFDGLDVDDAPLVAISTPVFETFLDAGTIPFLEVHPALKSPAFTDLVERINRDEGAHLAVNWLMSRSIAREHEGLRGLKLLWEPSVYRGAIAVPFLSLETYSLAHALGFDFRELYKPFGKLWRLDRKFPEFRFFPLWGVYRVFVLCGVIATFVASWLSRLGVIALPFWVGVTWCSDRVAWVLFGRNLLERRGLV